MSELLNFLYLKDWWFFKEVLHKKHLLLISNQYDRMKLQKYKAKMTILIVNIGNKFNKNNHKRSYKL